MDILQHKKFLESETLDQYQQRCLKSIVNNLPDNCKAIHFPGYRYDNDNSIKVHERERRTSGIIKREYKVMDQIITPSFTEFMASGKIKRLSKSLQYYVCTSRTKPENRNILADDLQLFLSGGFRDIKRSVMITKTSEIDMQQFCSNHEESDPRIIPDVLYVVQEQGG